MLLSQFHRGDFRLSNAIGSLMAMQVLQLNWPLPDLIVPLPASRGQRVLWGYDRNGLLAAQIGKILECPVKRILRCSFSFPAWLDEQIECSYLFTLKKTEGLCDKRILLVVDRFERDHIREAALALRDGFPLEIHVICFV